MKTALYLFTVFVLMLLGTLEFIGYLFAEFTNEPAIADRMSGRLFRTAVLTVVLAVMFRLTQ